MMQGSDILICGGGIVGITLARELLNKGADSIVILEKEPDLGLHASGRNSGVLHAGIYYPPGTLKAISCLEGNRRMKAYCREHNLPLEESGKVIVARTEAELPTLNELYKRAQQNGARVDLVSASDLDKIEPNAFTVDQAIVSHDTAVVDPKRILAQLRSELEATGKVKIQFDTRVVKRLNSNTVLTTSGPIQFDLFINAAGSWSDRIAHLFDVGRHFRMIPFKGTYRKLRPELSDFVRGSIYPVPDIRNPFLGVHFTRGIHGDITLGPTAIPAFGRENYGLLSGLDSEALSIVWRDIVLFCSNPKFRQVALTEPRKYNARTFFNDASALVKSLDPQSVISTDKVGIRPQLVDWKNKELVMDFHVVRQDNSIHILNAISPAFTCSLYMAEKIVSEYVLNG